jgi:hypothetical protein
MVLYDGSTAARGALEMAGQIAQAEQGKFVVLLLAGDRGSADRLQKDVLNWNTDRRTVSFLWAADTNPELICAIARTSIAGLLVVPNEQGLFSELELTRLLNETPCPVLFIGGD